MLRDSVPHRAYAPMSNTASHDNHEKINSWVSLDFHIWDAYGAPLGGPFGRRSSAITIIIMNAVEISQSHTGRVNLHSFPLFLSFSGNPC